MPFCKDCVNFNKNITTKFDENEPGNHMYRCEIDSSSVSYYGSACGNFRDIEDKRRHDEMIESMWNHSYDDDDESNSYKSPRQSSSSDEPFLKTFIKLLSLVVILGGFAGTQSPPNSTVEIVSIIVCIVGIILSIWCHFFWF